MFLTRNNYQSVKIALVALLFLILLASNLLLELSGVLTYAKYLYLRSVLSLAIVAVYFSLPKSTKAKWQRVVAAAMITLAGIYLFNVLLNMVNVYSFQENPAIEAFCAAQAKICTWTVTWFYKLKLFRFITLSSYFFLYPLITLVTLYLGSDLPKATKKHDQFQKVFLGVIFLLLVSNLLRSFHRVSLSVIQSYQIRNENYYDRFIFKEGGTSYYGWIRAFSNFILAQTPENAGLLVPPQALAYKMEGNINYFRWFLYPRRLYHLGDLNAGLASDEIDYIVVSGGECDSQQCVWPDFAIPATKIERLIFVNREDQSVTVAENVEYLPEKYQNMWGLIKLK